MIDRILKASLRHRTLVLLGAIGVMALGLYRTTEMPVDVFPDLTAPRVTVVTESTGLAAEEVERLITFPIEATLQGASGVRRVRSASAAGISVVWVEFDWNTDQNVARQRVNERLQSMTDPLPTEASAPLLAPASSVMGEIAFVALTSEEKDPTTLRRIAETEVRRQLLAVEGVSQVVAIGGYLKQYQVLIDAARLEPFGLSLHEVAEAVERGSLNAAGGYSVRNGQESVVRILGRAERLDEIAGIVITTRNGVPVTVRDVAEVTVGHAVSRGTASYGGRPAVLLSVVKQPNADTLSTTARMDAALDDLEASLARQGITAHRDVFRQQDFIDTSIANVFGVLRDGAFLVVVVLALFLWSMRPTFISVLAIPLSMLAAIVILDLLGLRIDTMTLGGLAIALGELVDDAIVDVENVVRRLRERSQLDEAQRPPIVETVYRASSEIRSAIVSATGVLMLVFLPLMMLEGLEGRLLRPLAVAYLVAILASLLVAVTVTPVLCTFLLKGGNNERDADESPVMRKILAWYDPIVSFCVTRPKVIALASLALVLLALSSFIGLGRAFLPEFNEGSLTINMVLQPGTSLEQSDALGRMAEAALLKDPAVLAVGRRTGRAERDEHVLGVETSELEVRLDANDPRTKRQVFADVRERLKAVPGAQFTLGQPISHRIEHMISGQRSALSFKIFGDDLRELRRIAEAIKSTLQSQPDLVDLNVEQVVELPQIKVEIDEARAAAYGLSRGEAAQAVSTAMWGVRPTVLFEDGTTTDVVVKYPEEVLRDEEAIGATRVPTPSGALVPVSAIAKVTQSSGPNYVLRENVARRLVVTANVAELDVRTAYEAARASIEKGVKMPPGYYVTYAGQFEQEAAALTRLLGFGTLALFGIGIIVAATLRSARRASIVLVNLPLALAGGVIGVYLAGGILSVATTIGFITLFGIATRNGILLATRARDLELAGTPRRTAVRQAAKDRLAPILMTAATAALGLLPLAMALGQPGSEIQAPMALVILTGLISSTVLNMMVVPALLAQWGGPPERAAA